MSHSTRASSLATITRGARLSLTCVVLAAAQSCSGGSSGSTESILGLSIAEQMSVVTTDDGSSLSAVIPHDSVPGDPPVFPEDSDYATDSAHSYVYDPSMETLSTVNQILCMLHQTGYSDLVNEANYKAQIDEDACEQGGDTSNSETGQSSGAGGGTPKIWVVHSTRPSKDGAQIVDFWVPQSEEHQGAAIVIRARMVITAGSSSANPFGVFVLNFAGVPEGGAITDAVFHGTLQTLDVAAGSIGFSFYENHGDVTVAQDPGEHSEITQANVNMSADQSQGVAYIVRQERHNDGMGDSGPQMTDYRLAFDQDHVLRSKDGDAGTCLSRTDFDTRVWRYNLYYASGEHAGQRVERNSGFGFRTEAGEYGYVGYYGIWAQDGATVANGDTITKNVFGQQQASEYTVVLAPGKLIKNTRHILGLTELSGESFEWWDFGEPGQPPMGPPARYRVAYQAGMFNRVAVFNDVTHEFDDLPMPVTIDTASYGFMGMWSQSLGGSVSFVHGQDFVTYYAQEFVNGANDLFSEGTTVDLYGYVQCLKAGISTGAAEAGAVYESDSQDVAAPYHYVFDASDLTLYYDVDGDGSSLVPAGLAQGASPSSGPFTWGMRSGPMVLDTSGLVSPYDAWTEDVFYTYETGANSWNHYAAIVDANGDSVVFDPPLQFTYTHSTASDRNGEATYDGRNYFLNYDGSGNLGGIPFDGIDLDGNGSPDRFYPVFSIADGTSMGPTGVEYVVRGIEMEATLGSDAGQCGALDIGTVGSLPLPDEGDYTPPPVGERPEVVDAPRVIEGVVIDSEN